MLKSKIAWSIVVTEKLPNIPCPCLVELECHAVSALFFLYSHKTSAGNRLIHCSAQSMTHNECAGYAQLSIKQKTTSNGLQAEQT